VEGVPFISKGNARFLFELITTYRLPRVLELGVAHGTATCCIAAALEEIGGGMVTSVDLEQCKSTFKPAPEEQLGAAGLSQLVIS
jgi:predicted O-methyltransferase YrrM